MKDATVWEVFYSVRGEKRWEYQSKPVLITMLGKYRLGELEEIFYGQMEDKMPFEDKRIEMVFRKENECLVSEDNR